MLQDRSDIIEKAYKLINEPIDPNLRVPLELVDIVDYDEAEPGETVEYFASSAQDRAADDLYVADAAGTLTYHKVPLKTVTALTFTGLQSLLETVLIDEILNSKDQGALAAKKDGIIRAMDKEEVRRILNLCLAVPSQEVSAASGEDLLDAIVKMKQKISDYATDYILLLGATVSNQLDTYDIDNATNFQYRMGIKQMLAEMGIKNIVKVIGTVAVSGAVGGDVLAATKGILIGRDSSLAKGRPIKFFRRKFTKQVAELSGANEGAVRLIDIAKTPIVVNAANANTLGYGVLGYESIIQVLTNYRAIAWCQDFNLHA
jgi:hypothetical protein